MRTVPCSSVTSCGSSRIVAPCARACAMQRSTSGTSSAMSTMPSPWRRWWSSSGLVGSTPPLSTNRTAPLAQHVGVVVAVAGLRAGVGDQLHPEDRPGRQCAAWVALPTDHTTASQPVTGNGSAVGVVLDEADELAQLRRDPGRRAAPGWSGTGRRLMRARTPEGGPLWQAASPDWPLLLLLSKTGRLAAVTVCLHGCARRRPARRRAARSRHPRAGRARAVPHPAGGPGHGPGAARPPRAGGGHHRRTRPTSTCAAAGYGVQAFVTLEIAQGDLDEVTAELRRAARGARGLRHHRLRRT